jgi:hypothetical protein
MTSLHLEKIMKKILLTAVMLMTGVAAWAPTQANAQVGVSIVIGNAPPPPRYEVVPAPRYGYVWIPGYWNWDGRRHVWHEGYWERERPGFFFEEPHWYQGPNGWVLERGGWREGDRARWEYEHRTERYDWRNGPRPGPDRNHDGVPDRFEHNDRDRHGNGDRDHDGVPNRVDHDRDGDGVPNRFDRNPDNPRRN